MRISLVAALALAALLGAAEAQQPAPGATATIKDRDGKTLGEAKLAQMEQGLVVHLELEGLPPGWHGVHVHGAGKCEPPFASAGGHFNPANRKHGLGAEGSHAGDLPNIFADPSGHARAELVAHGVKLADLRGPSGASIVVHAKEDDYATDPAGNSGDRIACGVVGS